MRGLQGETVGATSRQPSRWAFLKSQIFWSAAGVLVAVAAIVVPLVANSDTSAAPSSKSLITATSAPAQSTTAVGASNSVSSPSTEVAGPVPGHLLWTSKEVDLTSFMALDLDGTPPKIHDTAGTVEALINSGPGNMKLISSAGTLRVLPPGQKGDYDSCVADTRYTDQIDLAQAGDGALICVTSTSGRVGLLQVLNVPDPTSQAPYLGLAVTLWQGEPVQ